MMTTMLFCIRHLTRGSDRGTLRVAPPASAGGASRYRAKTTVLSRLTARSAASVLSTKAARSPMTVLSTAEARSTPLVLSLRAARSASQVLSPCTARSRNLVLSTHTARSTTSVLFLDPWLASLGHHGALAHSGSLIEQWCSHLIRLTRIPRCTRFRRFAHKASVWLAPNIRCSLA
jgi:hypothetical protein